VRDESRLFVMPRGGRSPNKHGHFRELAAHLPERSLLVLNDTRVLAARLQARKPTGGAVELLLTRAISAAPASGRPREAPGVGPGEGFSETWEALGRGLGNASLGLRLEIAGAAAAAPVVATLVERGEEGRFVVRLEGRGAPSLAAVLDSLAVQPPTPSTQSLVFVVWDNPPIVIGAGSYLDRLAALAGARNVFHDVGSPSAQVSIETIAARDPDFVALLSDSAVPPRYATRPEWRVVRAVRNARFLFLPGQLFGRPGPRAAEAIRELRRRLEAAP